MIFITEILENLISAIKVIVTILGGGAFIVWQVKRLLDGKFSIFHIIGIFLVAFVKELLKPSKPNHNKGKYLNVSSALEMGMDLEDIYSYNMGNPIAKRDALTKEPYIQKTKYF